MSLQKKMFTKGMTYDVVDDSQKNKNFASPAPKKIETGCAHSIRSCMAR